MFIKSLAFVRFVHKHREIVMRLDEGQCAVGQKPMAAQVPALVCVAAIRRSQSKATFALKMLKQNCK